METLGRLLNLKKINNILENRYQAGGGDTMQWFPCTNLGPANNWQTAWENLKMFTGDGTVAFTQGNIVIVSQDQDKIYLKLEIASHRQNS